ncbi:MAG: M3 family metallopeptidase [Xanthobacteraceae bacterium]
MSERDHPPHAKAPAKAPDASPHTASNTSPNPLLENWTVSGGVPPFDRIAAEHFTEAYAHALAEHETEIAVVASDPAPPSFANTIVAMELSGRTLDRIGNAFHLLAGAHSNDALLEIERNIAPQIARHWNTIQTNAALFRRIDSLLREVDNLGLDAEQKRVLKRYHTDFRRAGAGLDAAAKKRVTEIIERLAALGTAFSQNVLADEQAFSLRLDGEEELAGLPDFTRETLRSEARERGIDGYAVTLSRSTVEPFLQFSDRRDLREKVFRGFVMRGDNGGPTDNKAIIAEMVRLRAERAQLLGYADFAHYRLDDAMAKTPSEVRALLDAVWTPARASALADRDAMQALVQEEGGNFNLEPWDWRYYAEKLRHRVCNFDEAAIKPYLGLDRIIEAAFYTAQRLFGLQFAPAPNVPVWHPDVRVWRVSDADGNEIGLFFGDYFARGSKRSGAWMTALRDQQKLAGHTPLIINVCNFAKAPAGEPTLLSFEDARTLFHEFGHALHGLLSAVTYPTISGTNVATDFVELPSQLYEHWLQQPELLRRFSQHYQTGAAMPEELLQRLVAARNFNKGFATVEYIACASADLDLHSVPHAKDGDRALDPSAFEAQSLADMGMPGEIAMRHRLPHFAHIFAGGGYAAGYYSYMWSEVLDADAFSAFEETGDIFDPATAKRLRQSIYAAGGLQEPAEAYKAFRGRLPTADALLRKRGFVAQDIKAN